MSMQEMDAKGVVRLVANKKLAQSLERTVRELRLVLRLRKSV